jgi:taurine dioxygenase
MLTIEPTGAVLGATVRGIDLAEPLGERDLAQILLALGRHGVLRFPGQHLDLGALRRFSEHFGEIQGPATRDRDPTQEYPEIDILSNLKVDGKYIGSPDAGQGEVHVGELGAAERLAVAVRDADAIEHVHEAYEALPDAIKTRLDGMTATHNIEKFWEHMRRVHNSPRPPMTDEQRRRRPPVTHPVFLTHPITGGKVLYCNPGFTERINELPERESEEMLGYLFTHQLQPQFRYTNVWAENDLLLWDHLGTIHRAIADYGPDEIRLVRRCQVMATKVFDPEFLRPARELAASAAA